jgi:maltooligosyltrehalose trehalohydrolase
VNRGTTRLGATPTSAGTEFLVWAPDAGAADVSVEGKGVSRLERLEGGYFGGLVEDAGAGNLYRFSIDQRGPYPDPASRYQPRGVHGPSQIVDPDAYRWHDSAWSGRRLRDLVFYELHVGTFTPEGTFAGVRSKLPYLRDLGVTAIELMPLADFPGRRNWGYDGASLFAPARCYGSPDELRELVDAAHTEGLAVYLDVVYNHFGPDGAYAAAITRRYFSRRHRSPWGAGINLDGPHSEGVRRFFIENAIRWLEEYHFDGLRLDATERLIDESEPHLLAELTDEVRRAMDGCGREIQLIAEDHRNLAHIVRPVAQGGWGLDAVWADDFHHNIRRHLAGDDDGYFTDFPGHTEELAATLQRGWYFTGQFAKHYGVNRGTDPAGIGLERFVICIQNHDQVGNRAMGDRLSQSIDPAAYRAASVLLLLAPETPILFMGQEWAATTPFQFFTDHHEELGRKVTRGRRKEFQSFRAFTSPQSRRRIPDPQAAETFQRSLLEWAELDGEAGAASFRLYRRVLALRREILSAGQQFEFRALPAGDGGLILRYRWKNRQQVLVIVRTRGAGTLETGITTGGASRWEETLSTEQTEYASSPTPQISSADLGFMEFQRPGAVVLRALPATMEHCSEERAE